MRFIRSKLTFANVVALLALFARCLERIWLRFDNGFGLRPRLLLRLGLRLRFAPSLRG